MPRKPSNGLRALSLFSGGGGLDFGFERAGYSHVASYDILDVCGDTLSANRPDWQVYAGEEGDVTQVDWSRFRGEIEIIHGGPPCQPFSVAGKQKGAQDERDMWPNFVDSVLELHPLAFVAENVPGLLNPKFSKYIEDTIRKPLSSYTIHRFILHAAGFGVPQHRKRVFFVGFSNAECAKRFSPPCSTHAWDHLEQKSSGSVQPRLIDDEVVRKKCFGVRESLGLPPIGADGLAPTLRSGFTGPRNSTSVLNSVASQHAWSELQIWPNGVATNRERASVFVAKNRHFRLSVQDCALIQGFPASWKFSGGVYKVLGQIGNSVAPPMAYAVADAVAEALSG